MQWCGKVNQFFKHNLYFQAPIALMDLCKCTEQSIQPATMDVCSRPYAFSVDMLVNTAPSLIEKKR